jgi:hypothetical protein
VILSVHFEEKDGIELAQSVTGSSAALRKDLCDFFSDAVLLCDVKVAHQML